MIACKDQAIIYCGQPILLENGIYENTDYLKNIAKQIEEYFQKRRQSFDFHYIFLVVHYNHHNVYYKLYLWGE